MRKVLVTGGAGYIGAHTAYELFNAGFEPVLIDDFSKSDRRLLEGLGELMKKPAVFYEGDCADRDFLKRVFGTEHDITGVLHFAAYKSVGESVEKPLMYYRNNLNSMLALLEVMRDFHVANHIFSSSCTVYGEPDHIPVAEDAPLKPAESPYGATKQMCERILEDACRADLGLKAISLRYFNPIGAHPSALLGELPLDRPDNLVPYITQTAAGVREKLVIFGGDYPTPDGTCIRDFIHVVDLAKAHVAALRNLLEGKEPSNYSVYNLGTGEGVSVLQLVKTFIAATGVSLPYEIGPRRPGDVVRTYADPSKAVKGLSWQAEYSIRDALLHAWEWEKRLRQKPNHIGT